MIKEPTTRDVAAAADPLSASGSSVSSTFSASSEQFGIFTTAKVSKIAIKSTTGSILIMIPIPEWPSSG